ncbi:hypothetical protein J6590_103329, partial [Homalodisca vitripennis]
MTVPEESRRCQESARRSCLPLGSLLSHSRSEFTNYCAWDVIKDYARWNFHP